MMRALFVVGVLAAGGCGPEGRRVVRQQPTTAPDADPRSSHGLGGSGGVGGAAGAPAGDTGAAATGGTAADAAAGSRDVPELDRPPMMVADAAAAERSRADLSPTVADAAPSPPTDAPPPVSDARPPSPLDAPPMSPAVQLGRGLVLYWKLDETAGTTARDLSVSANHGTLVNFLPADWTAGRLKGGLRFDAAKGAMVTVPDAPSLNPTAGLTIAAWVKVVDWASNRRVLQKGKYDSQYRLLAEEGLLTFDLRGVVGGVVTAPLPRPGTWHHVAGTYDGVVVRLYVDAVVVATQAARGPLAVTADPLVVGQKSLTSGVEDGLSGVLDELVVYDRGLNAAEIGRLATGSPPIAP